MNELLQESSGTVHKFSKISLDQVTRNNSLVLRQFGASSSSTYFLLGMVLYIITALQNPKFSCLPHCIQVGGVSLWAILIFAFNTSK